MFKQGQGTVKCLAKPHRVRCLVGWREPGHAQDRQAIAIIFMCIQLLTNISHTTIFPRHFVATLEDNGRKRESGPAQFEELRIGEARTHLFGCDDPDGHVGESNRGDRTEPWQPAAWAGDDRMLTAGGGNLRVGLKHRWENKQQRFHRWMGIAVAIGLGVHRSGPSCVGESQNEIADPRVVVTDDGDNLTGCTGLLQGRRWVIHRG